MGLVFYVSPHLIFWVIYFCHILEKYQSVRDWKWGMLALQKQFERNWLRSHSGSVLQTECSSDGTAVAPQTGSWCKVLWYLGCSACIVFAHFQNLQPFPWFYQLCDCYLILFLATQSQFQDLQLRAVAGIHFLVY